MDGIRLVAMETYPCYVFDSSSHIFTKKLCLNACSLNHFECTKKVNEGYMFKKLILVIL